MGCLFLFFSISSNQIQIFNLIWWRNERKEKKAAQQQPASRKQTINQFSIDLIGFVLLFAALPLFAKSIHQQSLHFSSFINHFFIYWPPINLKKWIDWREWRVDELNGADQCRIQLNKAKQFTIPILKENCEIVLAVVGAVRPILPGSTKFINNLSFCSFINSFTKIKLLSKLSLTR